MMFWTIIAPELTLAWAMRQWFGAWEIRDAVNGTTSREGWCHKTFRRHTVLTHVKQD